MLRLYTLPATQTEKPIKQKHPHLETSFALVPRSNPLHPPISSSSRLKPSPCEMTLPESRFYSAR